MKFDLNERTISVFHNASKTEILKLLEEFYLGVRLIVSEQTDGTEISAEDTDLQRRLLWAVLAIDFVFFVLEVSFGFIASSMGLIAD